MSINFSHIAGLCLSILSASSSIISKLAAIIFSLLLIKVMFIWLKTFRFKRKFRSVRTPSLIKEFSLKYNLQGKIKVVVDKKPFAFCLGFFHPQIFVSTGLIKIMKRPELEMILLHEKYHLLKNDTRTMLIFNFLKQLFIFFPVVLDIIDGLIKQKEALADQYGVVHMGNNSPVISAFRKLLNYQTPNIPVLNFGVSFTNINTLEYRIETLKGMKPKVISFKLKNIFVSILTLFILLSLPLFFRQIIQAHEKETTLTCLKGHTCQSNC